MKFKLTTLMLSLAITSSAFADTVVLSPTPISKLIHFDSVKNEWSDQYQSINGMNVIYSIITAGKYSLAMGGISLDINQSTATVAFNDGMNWTSAQHIPGLPYFSMTSTIYPAYARDGKKPFFWITGYSDPARKQKVISYFDGKTFSTAIPMPQLSHRHDFIVSNHRAFVVDFSDNSIIQSLGAQWLSMPAIPQGSSLIAATAKNGDGDLFLLGVDNQNNQYFVISFLANETWSKPIYLPTEPAKDVSGFQVLSVTPTDSNSIEALNFIIKGYVQKESHYFESNDYGQTWFDYGVVPFDQMYNNNNWGHVFWKLVTDKTNKIANLMYADPTTKTISGWTSVSLPGQWKLSASKSFAPTYSSFSGHKGGAGFFFYDIDSKKLFNVF